MKKLLKIVLIVAGIIIFPQISNAQVTHYVSPTGGNVSPYTNWGDAANNIQDAINVSNPGDMVLVDDGTYLLSTNISITTGITVQSVNGYSSTIVDGNNATRCFYIDDANAILDGFTIQNGYNPSGFGGGVNIDNGGTVVNCYITGNQARDGGGIALDDNGSIYNCIITGNSADNNSSNGYGGGIRFLNGGTARNCLIYDNNSERYGGGINIWNAGTVQNCTITGNDAPNGGGIRARSNSTIENCIIYFNTSSGSNYNWEISGSGQTFSYSCSIPALPSGTGNTTDDPLFENAGANDYHLSASSTLINAGLNDAWMTGVFDLDGNERIYDGTVDMGAYEFKTVTPISDDFFPEISANSFWRLYDPVGDAGLLLTGTNAKLSIPGGVEHNLWTSNSDAPRLLQSAPDADFTIEVKFESTPTTQYQLQGIIVQETNDKFIRFGTYSSGSPNLFCAVIDGTTLIQTPSVPTISQTQHFLRVERSSDTWTYSYSDDGTSWNVAATFTQAFAVTEVGFYAGNAGGNPAFTANADYFMNLADPITDTDSQPLSPPVIDVWYGDTQNFGQLGNPQSWINILGRVTDDISVASLSYSLNGSPSNSLVIGPNGTRLVGTGDFNIEIDRSSLLDGLNEVEIIALDGDGEFTNKPVIVNYSDGNIWSLPYTLDWGLIPDMNDINLVAEVVDGLWELVAGGIRTVETGYDRLLVVGDQTWTTNYEVEVPITIHSNQGDAGIGFALGWQGHTGSTSPRTGWPLQAIGWVRYSGGNPQLRILTYTTGVETSQAITITNGVTYILKAKSEAIGGGQSRFYVKIWEDGTAEPGTWMIQADIATRDGSVLMITHKADVTWGYMTITPLASNLPPQFTSTPVTSIETGQLYSYNITASDPNVGDVLSISATTLPAWLALTDNGDGTAALTGTPTISDLGSNQVELLVEDQDLLSDVQSFNIIVTAVGQTFPMSDNFCDGTILNTGVWEFYDPAGDGSVILNNGNAEISIPGGTGSHDLSSNLSPRLLQTIPDEDFAVQIKFDSAPSEQYQMQGFVVQTSTGARLRFETYFGTAPYFYVNTYGVSVAGLPINQAIGGAIPQYLRLDRTGNDWTFDYSYDGTSWSNVSTYTLDVPVNKVGFYAANHTPNPAFTVKADYFWNLDQPFPGCKAITLSAPNGGETYTVGDPFSISWTSQDITNVKIELTTNGGTAWTELIASTDASSGTYNTIVPNSPSSACKIKVTDTADPSFTDVSDNVFTIESVTIEPTIQIGSANSYAGATVVIPVDLLIPSSFQIGFMLQGKIHFDPAKLNFKFAEYGSGTLVNLFGWTAICTSAIPGVVDIILLGNVPINTSGNFINLNFQIIDNAAGTALLSGVNAEWIVDAVDYPFTINPGNIGYTDPPSISEERGDANLNFTVDIFDALSVLYHFIGFSPLTGQALINADADLDGDVDFNDYLTIIFYIYLHDWNYAFPEVVWNTALNYDGINVNEDVVEFPMLISNAERINSTEVIFNYNPDVYQYHTFSSNMRINGFVNAAEVAPGEVRFNMISAEEINEDLSIGSIKLKIIDPENQTDNNIVTSYKFNENELRSGPVFTVNGGKVTDIEDNPDIIVKDFALSQNYPNPFNPTTVIEFSIPVEGIYTIKVYNLIGQEITTLVNDNFGQGTYTVIFDGKDLVSGLYLYQLKGNNVILTKKMVLLR